MAQADRRALAAVLALGALLAFFYGRIDYAGAFADVDLRHYRRMAQAAPGLDLSRPQPFVYRIGGPWFAGVTPLPDPLAFGLWAVVGSLALLAGLYAYVRRTKRPAGTGQAVGAGAALAAVALFALNPYWFGLTLFDPFQLNDLLVLGALVGAFAALDARRWGALALALALGALCRESALLAVPAALVVAAEGGRWRQDGPRAALAVLPALAVFGGLRLLIEPAGGAGLGHPLVTYLPKAAEPETWFRLLVSSAAPVSLLPLVFWRETRAFFAGRRFLLVYLVAVLASCFFGHDQERLMQPAALVVYPLIAVLIERRLRGRPWALGVVLAAGLAGSLHHLVARYPLPSRSLRVALVLTAIATATAAALVVRLRERAQSRTSSSSA